MSLQALPVLVLLQSNSAAISQTAKYDLNGIWIRDDGQRTSIKRTGSTLTAVKLAGGLVLFHCSNRRFPFSARPVRLSFNPDAPCRQCRSIQAGFLAPRAAYPAGWNFFLAQMRTYNSTPGAISRVEFS